MITDYTILSTKHKNIKEVYVWNHMIWVSRSQLEQLFHVKKARIETLLDQVDKRQLPLQKHVIVLSIVKQRKQADGKEMRDWIHQVRHFDLDVIQAIVSLEPCSDAEQFLQWAKQELQTV